MIGSPEKSFADGKGRALAAELGLEKKIHFLGAVTQDQLPALYRRAALFVAPFIQARTGDQEGLGLVTVEAIGCGCPVIVSDLPAVRDVVQDASRRAKPGDSDDLTAKIIGFLDQNTSEADAIDRELRIRAQAHFDWQAVAIGYANVLRESAG
ncbi:MAG: glycosyltransferase [Wenzhouxiangellaceae bacterium]|nr:glycosyltransferase [Wenzhouxiangellaceae bacterium]